MRRKIENIFTILPEMFYKLLLTLCFALIYSCVSVESKGKYADSAPEVPLSSEEASSSSSSVDAAPEETGDLLTDGRDGKTYRIVAINAKIWMAENLNHKTKSSKCYANDDANCDTYGRLYTLEEAQEACPSEWHLPTSKEWKDLIDYAGGKEKAGKKLKAKSGWNNFEAKSGNGTNDYGFSALAGGHANHEGKFSYIGDLGLWWSNNMNIHNEFSNNWFMNSRGMAKSNDFFSANESHFSSIRCVKDSF